MHDLTIALDAMGGDFGPQVSVPAVQQALNLFPQLHIILVGATCDVMPYLKQHQLDCHPRFRFVHASETVGMNDTPLQALRGLKDSSMRVALNLVQAGEAQACVSGGNTGALMALSKMILKSLPGIDRPALITAMPNTRGTHTYLLDIGANVSCEADTLFQFALMGSVLAEKVEGLSHPKVALLNVGEEEIKGNDQVKRAAQLLANCAQVNYAGFIEGHDVFTGKADVIVADGFVGNITLKTSEGLAKLFKQQLISSINHNWFTRCLGYLLKPSLKPQLAHLNPDLYNGASLIGLRGIVIKSHGSAQSRAFLNAIKAAVKEVERQVPAQITDKLEAVLLERDS
ncbi:phosphate acyltransferase PlsX [Motilimonas eburnea]|uniref:phosphate acyltransferase PlsX n=1 Tax=Motilimonas eburnea TaxID=1737488 RepID=UPI001E4FD017|nr:phosphate acyltransferase PlsX [Motilimonas eburnea]MCE2570327.1 phosphate acyltransferase PlsX [Motilimonas eburnea]